MKKVDVDKLDKIINDILLIRIELSELDENLGVSDKVFMGGSLSKLNEAIDYLNTISSNLHKHKDMDEE